MEELDESMKTALITGITGQDGSYLAELLLEKGYEVFGVVRRLSTPNTSRIDHMLEKITLLQGDLGDVSSLYNVMKTAMPNEVYNLAAQSFVGTSWNQPILTGDITGLGVVRLLESVKNSCSDARVYQASSSEMFGKVQDVPQNESTKFYPRSPYGVAKVYGHMICINYRESYNMHINNGILFNHESPRRGIEFVTRKITNGVARIYHGLSKELRLGNLDAQRDWGYAGDYVEAMWKMLQQPNPDDYVIATGEMHSVQEFAEVAFNEVGLNWEDYVVVDEKFIRPAEVEQLCGDATKAKMELDWTPKTSFEDLVKMMVKYDVETLNQI